jgi:hypothetical protein
MLRKVPKQKHDNLQVFCKLQKSPANYRAAFTRQGSLVRTQHRPSKKCIDLQVKSLNSKYVGPRAVPLLTTVDLLRECLSSTIPISGASSDGHPRERRATTPTFVVCLFCRVRIFGMLLGCRSLDNRAPERRVIGERGRAFAFDPRPGVGLCQALW